MCTLLSAISLLLQVEIGLLFVAFVLLVCLVVGYKSYPLYGLHHWLPMRLHLSVSVQQSHLEIGSEVLQDCVHKFDCGHNAQYLREPKIFDPANPPQIFA